MPNKTPLKQITVSQPTTKSFFFIVLMLLDLSLASSRDIFSGVIFFLINFFFNTSSLHVGFILVKISLLFFKILYREETGAC